MKPSEREIVALSGRLQANLHAFSGKSPGLHPRFRAQLLIPVAVIVGALVLFSLSPRARKTVLVELAMLASARLIHCASTSPVPRSR